MKRAKPRRFAEGTKVPTEVSRQEIEKLLRTHGATGFATMWDKGRFAILFELKDRRVRFDLPAPSVSEYPKQAAWDAEERRRWRSLLLIVKAKLELVESGDAEFEAEFLAYLVLRDGDTIGARMLPQLTHVLDTAELPPMLPGRRQQ